MSDVQKLLAEARRRHNNVARHLGEADATKIETLTSRMADALESAISERDASDRAFQALKAQSGARDAELVSLKAKLAAPSPVELEGDVDEHVRDRYGICSRCGAGLTAVEILDGPTPCPALSRPVGGETATEWGYRPFDTGEVMPTETEGQARFVVAYTGRADLVQRCGVFGPWSPVSPEQDGGKA